MDDATAAPTTHQRRHSGPPRWALVALLALALALRLVYLYVGEATADDWRDQRFYDERYAAINAVHRLGGELGPPVNGFYPSLAHLPHLALLAPFHLAWRATDDERLRIVDGPGFTALGRVLARLVSCVFGLLSIVLVYRIGRRMLDPWIGLAAAALLALLPWHIWQSVLFKPGIVLVAMACLAFLAALIAAERGDLRAYLVAGAAVGLAIAAKYNGAPIAAPLIVAATLAAPRDPRALLRLAAAGAAAVATFLLLNPYAVLDSGRFRRDLGHTARDYASKGQEAAAGVGDVLADGAVWLADPLFHGLPVALLAAAGLLLLPATRVISGGGSASARGPLMLVSFPLAYAVAYALATRNLEAWHNWLVLTPFTALAAAWALVAGARRLAATRWLAGARWLEAPARAAGARIVPAALVTLAIVAVGWHGQRTLYAATVPTTARVVAGQLAGYAAVRPSGRLFIAERAAGEVEVDRGFDRTVVLTVDDLTALPDAELDLTDGEVFPARRLRAEDAGADWYRERMATPGAEVRRVDRRFLRARGPELVAVVHPWRGRGAVTEHPLCADPGAPRRLRTSLPPRFARFALSLTLWLPRDVEPAAVVLADGRRLPLYWNRASPTAFRWSSPRWRFAGPAGAAPLELEIELRANATIDPPPVAEAFRWSR